MAIKIIKEPDIYMTQAEHDRLQRAWSTACRYTTEPPTFEDFVASQMARSGVCSCPANGVSSACRMHGERPTLETKVAHCPHGYQLEELKTGAAICTGCCEHDTTGDRCSKCGLESFLNRGV